MEKGRKPEVDADRLTSASVSGRRFNIQRLQGFPCLGLQRFGLLGDSPWGFCPQRGAGLYGAGASELH